MTTRGFDVAVDPDARLAYVRPGCLLRDVDQATQEHGLATVLGFISETGVAGLTLGDGFGYLARRFGWAADNLGEVEIVTADGHRGRPSHSRAVRSEDLESVEHEHAGTEPDHNYPDDHDDPPHAKVSTPAARLAPKHARLHRPDQITHGVRRSVQLLARDPVNAR